MSRFTTQLPSYVDLSRNYELALVEFVYPNNFTNLRINDGARFRLLKQQCKKVTLPDYVPIAQTRDMERVAGVDTAVPAIDHLLSFVNKGLDESMKTVEVIKVNWKDNRVVISIKKGTQVVVSRDLANALGFKQKSDIYIDYSVRARNQLSYPKSVVKSPKWTIVVESETEEDIDSFLLLPRIYYSNMQEVMYEINSKLKSYADVAFSYNPFARITRVSFPSEYKHLVLSADLANLLGFTKDTEEEYVLNDPIYGAHRVNFDVNFNSILINCNLVESELIGGKMMPLLRSLDIEGAEQARSVREIFDFPYYKTLVVNQFGSIGIDITNEKNEHISFGDLALYVKLHFKRALEY
uniref:Uncharacterized protein n=1 Tax=Strigamia maritima TaxID=126957 RepID=T1IHC2_STRMM